MLRLLLLLPRQRRAYLRQVHIGLLRHRRPIAARLAVLARIVAQQHTTEGARVAAQLGDVGLGRLALARRLGPQLINLRAALHALSLQLVHRLPQLHCEPRHLGVQAVPLGLQQATLRLGSCELLLEARDDPLWHRVPGSQPLLLCEKARDALLLLVDCYPEAAIVIVQVVCCVCHGLENALHGLLGHQILRHNRRWLHPHGQPRRHLAFLLLRQKVGE